MNPDPDPCSTCGRRRRFGKKSWNPGGRRWLSSARSTCWDRMNTTDGFTCSATATNASWKSPADLMARAALRRVQRRARAGVGLLQFLQRLGDLVPGARAKGLLRPLHGLVEPGLERGVELVDPFLGALLHFVHQRVEAVAPLDFLAPPLVFRGVGLGILAPLVDVLVAEARPGLVAVLLALVGGLALRGHVQDPVRVDVERHLDLRHAARSGRDARQLEL